MAGYFSSTAGGKRTDRYDSGSVPSAQGKRNYTSAILCDQHPFSDWSKKDDMLYQVLRIPVEAVLGKDGVGLADCAIAESKFEKGEDITHRMLSLVQRAGEIQRNGTPDIEFAVTGLLIRSQMASGRSDDAVRTMEQLRTRFAENGLDRFLPNMDAMRCRMDLYVGDLDRADDWYREKAPRDLMKLNVMKR